MTDYQSNSKTKKKIETLKPFWEKTTTEKSKQLWLPTDCIDSMDKNLKKSSWFSTDFKTSKTLDSSYSLQKSLLQRKDVQSTKSNTKRNRKKRQKKKAEDIKKKIEEIKKQTEGLLKKKKTKKEKTIVVKKKKKSKKNKKRNKKKKTTKEFNAIKLRIYPNEEQKSILEKWFGATRFIYNRCLQYINEESRKPGYKFSVVSNQKNLRSLFVNKENYEQENTWLNEINYDIRDEGMRDLKKNYNSNFAKKEGFRLKFRNKKMCNSISVLSKHWNKGGDYSKVFTSNMRCEKPLPKKLNHTCRLIKTENDKYYICMPRAVNENQITSSKTVSIDPGVRTFMTCYDPEGHIIEFGKGDVGRIMRLKHYKSKLQSRMDEKLTKPIKRLALKIKNLVDDCHRKLCKWLCQNYGTIIIPKLDFHNFPSMSKRNKCKLISWRHCEFVDRLVHKSREYKNCQVKIVTEEYTSKTCGQCGNIKADLHSNKTYKCDKCKLIIDRDINGARNILLKYLTK